MPALSLSNTFPRLAVLAGKMMAPILILLPPAWIVWLIGHAGSLPDNDYWTYLSTILYQQGFSPHLNHWLSPSANEHIVLLPKMLYALNVWLSGGDNRALGAFAFLFAAMQVWLLYRMARHGPPATVWVSILLVLTVFLFPSRAVHNWMMGMSGVAWIGANLCAVGAFYLLWRQRLLTACLLATVGMFTYSTALAIWPTLVIGAWLLGLPKRRIAVIVAWGIVAVAVYLYQYHTPAHHPPLQKDPLILLQYFLLFLGGLLTDHTPTALTLGVLGLATSLWLWWQTLRQPKFQFATTPWIMLQLYALGNGGMAAIARSGFGLEQAFSSRYATLPALFWLGLVMLGWLQCRRSLPLPHLVDRCIAATVMILGISSWIASKPVTEFFVQRAALKPLALVSLYSGGFDYPLLHKAVTPVVRGPRQRNTLEHFMAILKANGHVPFDGTFAACPEMGERIGRNATPLSHDPFPGFFDQARRLFPETVKVRGWAHSRGGEIRCIAITNQDGMVRGIAIGGFSRPDVARQLQIEETASGWEGYARVRPGDLWLRAWARIGDTWQPLNRTLPVPPLARENPNSEVTHPK